MRNMITQCQFENFKKEIKGETVIVEGKKDRLQLKLFGVKKIIEISGKPIHNVIEKIKKLHLNSVTVLTDFDNEGKEKARLISQNLQTHKIKTNSLLRSKFKSLFKIHKIEELSSFTKFMEDDYYGQTCAVNYKIFNRSRFLSRWNRGKA